MTAGKGQGLGPGFDGGVGLTRTRQNYKSLHQMREQAWVEFVFGTGEPTRLCAAASGAAAVALFLAWGGPKIRVDGERLIGVSTKSGRPISATVRRGGRTLTHAELMECVQRYLENKERAKRETAARLARLDAELSQIGSGAKARRSK